MSVNSNVTPSAPSKRTANVTMHPILNSVVHHSFKSASKDTGCCEFTEQHFIRALTSYLPILTDAFHVPELDLHRLWTSMMTGEVIAVEHDAGTLMFHVQGRVFGSYVDMRFAYRTDVWSIQAVTSIHTRPLWRSRFLITVTASVLGMILTGLAGYGLAVQRSPLSHQTVASWASVHGYKLVQNSPSPVAGAGVNSQETAGSVTSTDANASTTNAFSAGANASSSAGSGSRTNNTTSNPVPSGTSSSTKQPADSPQSFQFHFTSGMTVHDISVFLQQHHLVNNAYDFDQVLQKTGIAQQIWPGTYTFTSTMKASEILQELKSKPKS